MSMPIIKKSGIARCEAISDIIESVALQQTGLSHILNAEGEKIQAFIEYSKTPEELLSVNKSVESMVNSITRLEFMLNNKLELFKDCLCDECKSKPIEIKLIMLAEDGGEIIREEYNSFKLTPTINEAEILFISDENAVIEVIDTLPEGMTFSENILRIPANYDWSRIYRIKFLARTEIDSCIVNLYNQII